MISKKYDCLLSLSPTHRFSWKINGDEAIPKYDFKNRPPKPAYYQIARKNQPKVEKKLDVEMQR